MTKQAQSPHEHERGTIQDNALKAVVTSKLFKTRVEKAKKGKGSYQRRAKHQGQEPLLNGFISRYLISESFNKGFYHSTANAH